MDSYGIITLLPPVFINNICACNQENIGSAAAGRFDRFCHRIWYGILLGISGFHV